MPDRKINISLTEEMIMNPSALPKQLRKWRMYRIKYGGPNESCIWEGRVMLPPNVDPAEFDEFMMKLQDRK
jgi:hypothetical protein